MEKNYSFAGRRSATNTSTRFDLRKGKFSRWIGHDSPREEFDFVQGKLKGIRLRQNETAGGEMTFMDVHYDRFEQCHCRTRLQTCKHPRPRVRDPD